MPSRPGPFNVLLVTSLFPPAVGGASQYFHLLTEAWEHEPAMTEQWILTEWRLGQPIRQRRGKTRICRILPPRDSYYQAPKFYRYLAYPLTLAILWFAVLYMRYRGQISICLIHGRYAHPVFLHFLGWIPIPKVILLTDQITNPADLTGMDAVICVCQSVYQRALRTCPNYKNFHLVYLPLKLKSAVLAQPPESDIVMNRPYILSVGGVMRIKGIDRLLAAFRAFARRNAQYHLALAGPLREPDWLRHQSDHIHFLGEQSPEVIAELMRGAALLVLPSRSEGLPRVCLEALALNVPLLVPPGIPEFLESCPESVIASFEPAALARQMEQILAFPPRHRYPLRRHDPQCIARQVLELCLQTAGLHD